MGSVMHERHRENTVNRACTDSPCYKHVNEYEEGSFTRREPQAARGCRSRVGQILNFIWLSWCSVLVVIFNLGNVGNTASGMFAVWLRCSLLVIYTHSTRTPHQNPHGTPAAVSCVENPSCERAHAPLPHQPAGSSGFFLFDV